MLKWAIFPLLKTSSVAYRSQTSLSEPLLKSSPCLFFHIHIFIIVYCFNYPILLLIVANLLLCLFINKTLSQVCMYGKKHIIYGVQYYVVAGIQSWNRLLYLGAYFQFFWVFTLVQFFWVFTLEWNCWVIS